MASLVEELNGAPIGFIGAGNMAWAIFQNVLSLGVPASQVIVSAPSDRNLGKWASAGATTTHDNGSVVSKCKVIILAMKPQHFMNCTESWGNLGCDVQTFMLFISVMAGMSCSAVEQGLAKIGCGYCQVVRTMPNTPMMVGQGATVFCPGHNATPQNLKITKFIFGSGGCVAEEVPESMMDAAGALVGCGPAFVYQFLEYLADGAVAQGVPRDLANRLTAQMVAGAAAMAQKSGKHTGLLKDEVCSPAGTTIAGLEALREGTNFSAAVMAAIKASTARSKELNKSS